MKFLKGLAFLTIIISLLSCFTNGYSSAGFESSFHDDKAFSNFLLIEETENPIRFYGIVILDKGSCTITITRPDGSVAKEYNLTAPGEKRLAAEFRPVKGRWELIMSSNNAEGAYKLKWTNSESESGW